MAKISQPAQPYRVLARKYRPTDFTGLIGQEALVRTLSNAFATGRIAHAFMLTGVRGVGKTTTARIIARALNCIGPDGKRTEPTIQPCGVCEPCISISESRNVDVQEMDAASRTGIDDIREIIEGVRYAPVAARYKVYIIDEVHMLSKQAFNGLLKTLEEPPPHVKFVFATTEIRKVPVTVLSRCQRFDLRRIDSGELAAYLATLAAKEDVKIEESALALIARAAEGSARDGLSLLDQAIAHSESDTITADMVRAMLGLADRGRVLDIFEKVMGGDIAAALTDLSGLYDAGADPLAVMQDLLETAHFLTRLKVAPAAQGFFDGGSGEARRAAELAAKLSVASLTRAWQILLKGLLEVRDATRPISACEMALIRLAYAAELPPTDKLVKDLLERGGEANARQGVSPPSAPAGTRAPVASGSSGSVLRAPSPAPNESAPTAQIRSLDDIAALAARHNAPILRVALENYVHLVSLEPGRIEFRPHPRAPRSLAGDLQQKLKDWTGTRWTVSIANAGGAPTLAEQKSAARTARFEAVAQEPMVRAVLDRFPDAQIVAVREVAADEIAPAMPESDSDS
ncbi:MAG TPA: DNA polymerase III subunit gamma/tau [Rhizomicrobium sp.]|jgi:DNA polymerase-3 subunit gamma/tau|nr:DNA polymerase III subunit gamma/tau [Rhizomicrobium sp.]HWA70037.1 DNA polymerase III subunit gamma/tau [Rhizomicrobium sp.]